MERHQIKLGQLVKFYSGSAVGGYRNGVVISIGRTNATVGYTFKTGRPTQKNVPIEKLALIGELDVSSVDRFNRRNDAYAIKQAKAYIAAGHPRHYTRSVMQVIERGMKLLENSNA